MAQTNIDIVNRALTRIGAPTITDFTDGSREAEVMNELYDHTYEALLTEAFWNFAQKDQELTQEAKTPTDPNFTYQYLVPTDYIQGAYYYSTSGTRITDYLRQGERVLANVDRLFSKYLAKQSEADFPPWFVNYLVVKLAHDAAEALIGIGSVQDRLAAEWQVVRSTAYKMDHSENEVPDALAPSRYIIVRS